MMEVKGQLNTALCFAKTLEEISELITESVEIVERIKTLYNFKAP